MSRRNGQASKNRMRRGRLAGARGWAWLMVLGFAGVGVGIWYWTDRDVQNPDVVVNLTTMVGHKAPEFTLADSEGQHIPVVPGRGRPQLIIFHMGSV